MVGLGITTMIRKLLGSISIVFLCPLSRARDNDAGIYVNWAYQIGIYALLVGLGITTSRGICGDDRRRRFYALLVG